MDEVNKDEKKDVPAKLQPTSEQLRLAQITQMADAQLDPQHRAKISQVRDKMRQTVFCLIGGKILVVIRSAGFCI